MQAQNAFRGWSLARCVTAILNDRNGFVERVHDLLEVSSRFNDEEMEALWAALFVEFRQYDDDVCPEWADAIRVLLERDLCKVVVQLNRFWRGFLPQCGRVLIDVGAKKSLRALIEDRSEGVVNISLRDPTDGKKWQTLTEYATEQGCEWFADTVAVAVTNSKRVQ